MISKSRVSGIIHIAGAALSLAALVLLVVFAATRATAWHVVSFSIFGTSMLLLYLMSSLYHMFVEGSRASKVFRHFDHMMIFVLIAGTYTPICLIPLRGPWGWTLFGLIWGLAVLGIIFKAVALGKARTLSTILYIFMGWLVVIAFYPLTKALPSGGIFWLVLGGFFYTAGGIIYAIKKPDLNCSWFGHHEIFHVLIILGSFCHYWLMQFYIMNIR